jgi:hypothetical protein
MVRFKHLLGIGLGLVGCAAGYQALCPPEKVGRLDPRIEQRAMVLPRRVKAKARVVEQVAAGRIDLFEAAAWFRYFNETPPDCPAEPIPAWPGATPEEKLCREVIANVRKDTHDLGSESRAEALAAQLERELTDVLARSGGVVLPSLGNEAVGG